MKWDTECQEAFDKIKWYLENPLVLVPAAPGRPLILYLTVLEESMGCIKKEHAIYYLSKKFTDCEMRYSALERTCCALVWTTKRLRPYMLSHTTWLVAKNDPVNPPLQDELHDGKWLYLNTTSFMVTTTNKPQYDDEWTIWFDGASNIVGNKVRVVLISPRDLCFPFAAKLGFDCTNNMAEYEACTMGLLMALEYQVKRLRVFGDSALVIYQLRGEWETRDAKLIPYHDHVWEIVTAFDMIMFCHVPREENQMVDALATLSAMVQMNEGQEMTIHFQHQSQMAYCQCLTHETIEPNIELWYFDIKRYLEKGEYSEGASENSKRTLRRLASGFLLSGATLYKRNTDMTLL
ncbi:rnhA, partial [Mucuna pruriens]